jgi:hypothetical protein
MEKLISPCGTKKRCERGWNRKICSINCPYLAEYQKILDELPHYFRRSIVEQDPIDQLDLKMALRSD